MALDWSRIDNEKTFQRLVNHLFALECNSPGFIPSSPYVGADGGWDGLYDGHYSPENRKGKWSIESKWTKHSFDQAAQHLRREVRKSVHKAKVNGARHLRVATNAELRPDQVVALEKLNRGLASVRVWHREALALRIERQPFLCHFFFGQPQFPKFVPSLHYFRAVEGRLLPGDAKVKAISPCLAKAREVIGSPRQHVLLMHAVGGLGKSHALRQVSEMAHAIDASRQPWLIQDGCRAINDAFGDELVADRDYLLLLDDADRRPQQELRDLLAFVKSCAGRVKAVVAFRSASRPLIERTLTETRCEEMAAEVRILQWDPEDLVALLRHAAGRSSVPREEEIVAAYRNPFIISWIGRSFGGAPGDIAAMKSRLLNDTRRDAQAALAGVGPTDVKVLLAHVAAVVPLALGDTKMLPALTKSCGLDSEALRQDLDLLVDAGILRRVSDKLRFDPDMKGDLLLAEAMEECTAHRTEELFDAFLPACPDRFLTNIEAAFRYSSSPVVRERLSSLVRTWTQSAGSTDVAVRAARMGYLENLASLVPEECLDLLAEYLRHEPVSTHKESRRRLVGRVRLTTDEYGPPILRLVHIPSVRKSVLRVIADLEQKSLLGTYANYKPPELIRQCVSPVTNPVPTILETFGVVAEWLQGVTTGQIALIASALTEVLGEAHQTESSTARRISLGQVVLRDTPDGRTLRDTAMSLLGQLLRHQDLEAQLAAVEVAESHGRAPTGLPLLKPLPLEDKIRSERQDLARQLGQEMRRTDVWRLRSAIEDVLLHWWASGARGSAEAKKHLSRLQRPVAYLVMRHFVSPGNCVNDFMSLASRAPRKDRWGWYLEQMDDIRSKGKSAEFKALAASLAVKHAAPADIIGYLVGLEELIAPHSPWAHPPIVSLWVPLKPGLFRTVRSTARLWGRVPERFKPEIDSALVAKQKGHLKTIAREITRNVDHMSLDRVDAFLRLVRRYKVGAREEGWAAKLVDRGNEKVRACVASHAFRVYEDTKNADALVRIVTRIIKHQRRFDGLVDSVAMGLHRCNASLALVSTKAMTHLRRLVLSRLRTIEDCDHYVNELLRFARPTIDEVCGLVGHRILEHERRCREGRAPERYTVVPSMGLGWLKDALGDYDGFMRFMDWVVRGRWERYICGGNEVEGLVRPLFEEGERRFIGHMRRYLAEKVEAGEVDDALAGCKYLPLAMENINSMLEVAAAARRLGKVDGAKRMFSSHLLPTEGMSSGLGEPPPELVRRKGVFLEMAKQAGPGLLASFLKELAGWFDAEIQRWQREDEEILDPRV